MPVPKRVSPILQEKATVYFLKPWSQFVSQGTDGQRIGVPVLSSSLSCLTWSISP